MQFLATLPLIERGASDDRNFVKKGVSWALRVVGRSNRALNEAAVEVARRLAESTEASARWVGKDGCEGAHESGRAAQARPATRGPDLKW